MHQLIAKERLRQVLLVLGVVGLVVAATMTWRFGSTMTTPHGLLLVGITLLAGVIFAAREILTHQRDSWGSWIALLCGALFLAIELFSHIGYTVAMRANNVETGETQNVRYDDGRDKVKVTKDSLQATKDRLTKIEGDHPWAVSTTSVSLAAMIPSADKAIELETARGGCKTVCKKRMDEKGALLNKIALAEEAERARATIAEVEGRLASYQDKSAVTKKGDSTVRNQTYWVSQMVSLSLSPEAEMRTGVEIAISLLIALGGVCFAPTCLWLWARLAIQLDAEGEVRDTLTARQAAEFARPAATEHRDVRKVGEGAPRPEPGREVALAPIEVDVPITVRTTADHQHAYAQEEQYPQPTRRITRVRENAFARRIHEVTANLRGQRAA